jgi:hypothetical protein
MIEAQIQGIGRVWVSALQLSEGPFRHPPFSQEVREYLRRIKTCLDEVFPQTLEKWEDGFRRDQNAAQEIAIWLHIASVYEFFTSNKELTANERREYFHVIHACSTSPREHVLQIFNLTALSRKQAEQVIDRFYSSKSS